MLEENVFIANIFDAIDRLRKKGKGQYKDNITDVCRKDFYVGNMIVTDNLELVVQTNIMERVVANNRVTYRLIKGRNVNSISKEEKVPEQETIIVSLNEPCEGVPGKDNVEQLIKFQLKTQLKELTHLSSTLPSQQLRVQSNNRDTKTKCEIYSK